MKSDLGKEIISFYDNLRKRQQLDEELKMTLSNFFSLIDEKADRKELKFSNDDWKRLGLLAGRSLKNTENLWKLTNFIAEKF
ncbi:MAG: hypothetical protein LBT51_00380 [Fusobacteriaceae bacterium]|nr:hypothetical protein [Fusobacteriaceae bacterium]